MQTSTCIQKQNNEISRVGQTKYTSNLDSASDELPLRFVWLSLKLCDGCLCRGYTVIESPRDPGGKADGVSDNSDRISVTMNVSCYKQQGGKESRKPAVERKLALLLFLSFGFPVRESRWR
ncbi:hypothetical protein SLE2022_050630 [Rubroshorea leprosula]